MKNIVIVLLICLLFSCAIQDDSDSGSLNVSIPSYTELAGATQGNYTHARIYLLAYGSIYPIGGSVDYIETTVSNTQYTLSIENIPTCSEYVLWLAIGTKEVNGAFDVAVYGESDEFELLTGNNVELTIALKDSPFVKAQNTLGYHIGSVVRFLPGTGDLYAPSLHSFFTGIYDGDLDDVVEDTSFDSSYTINSITEGYVYPLAASLYFNTNDGIIPYDGSSSYDYTFSDDLPSFVPILKSCAFVDGSNAALYFMRDGGFGGVYVDGDATWDWLDVDLSNVILGQPALDLTASADFAYFVTKFGAFRLNEDLVNGYVEGADADYTGLAEFFEIRNSGIYVDVLCISYDSVNDIILIGTEDGVWWADVNLSAGDVFVSSPTQFSLTAGQRFTHIKVSDNYIVAATPTYFYLIRRQPSFAVERFPFIAGIPGTITSLAGWDSNVLLISGTEGLVALNAAGILFD